jgi:hypothetical protein
MGPVEIVFVSIWVVFGIIGVVRGVWRELGVTTMLLIALLLLQLLTGQFAKQWNAALGLFIADPGALKHAESLIAVAFLLVIAFISYQGDTLTFPGKGDNWFFSLGTGLLNGYLFAGSIWYYLDAAGWPGGIINSCFSTFYTTMVKLLPPAVLQWQLLILLVVFMMIMRVIK